MALCHDAEAENISLGMKLRLFYRAFGQIKCEV